MTGGLGPSGLNTRSGTDLKICIPVRLTLTVNTVPLVLDLQLGEGPPVCYVRQSELWHKGEGWTGSQEVAGVSQSCGTQVKALDRESRGCWGQSELWHKGEGSGWGQEVAGVKEVASWN